MKLANNAPSIWPGYVAAIASLVLSLLLLLAILVIALTQVGNLVSQFRAEILRDLLEKEAALIRSEPTPLLRQPLESRSLIAVVPKPAKKLIEPSNALPKHIKLIFGNGLADIPASQNTSVIKAIESTQTNEGTTWLIRASVVPNDPLMERATYQLMLAVRKILVAQKFSESRIHLQLEQSTQVPQGYDIGEIIITLTPHESKFKDGRAP